MNATTVLDFSRHNVGVKTVGWKNIGEFQVLWQMADDLAEGFIVDKTEGVSPVWSAHGAPTGRDGDQARERYISVWYGPGWWVCASDYILYATRAEAELEQNRRFSQCNHQWRVISHEERGCHRCGCVQFIPDY